MATTAIFRKVTRDNFYGTVISYTNFFKSKEALDEYVDKDAPECKDWETEEEELEE